MKSWTIPALIMLMAGGCPPQGRNEKGFPTPETFVWETSTFHVGMSKADALRQLKDAVPIEEFDPKGKATIIRPDKAQLAADSWVLGFVSPRPVGPECTVRFSFVEGALAKMELVSEAKAARREAIAYPTTQEFVWAATKLRVGMNKDEVLEQLMKGAARPGMGGVSVPGEEEVAADAWMVGCSGRPEVGNAAWIRLTFKKRVLERIQIVAVLQ